MEWMNSIDWVGLRQQAATFLELDLIRDLTMWMSRWERRLMVVRWTSFGHRNVGDWRVASRNFGELNVLAMVQFEASSEKRACVAIMCKSISFSSAPDRCNSPHPLSEEF